MTQRDLFLVEDPLPVWKGIQSVLHPEGWHTHQIAEISWTLFIGGALIFLFVMALATYALFAPVEKRRRLARRGLIVGGGIVFPVVTLTALLVYTFVTMADDQGLGTEPASLHIEVTGEMWWWRVHYLDDGGRPLLRTANEIVIPVGQVVELKLKSADVIHSFWVPQLAGKVDMIPGQVNVLRLRADRPGIYRGQCAEYCGAQHALMAFYVVAHMPAEFETWFTAQQQPSRAPQQPLLKQGQELFLSSGCQCCHTVRGIEAHGKLGPDLTHIGSRLSLGAGSYPNNIGTLGGWIAASQHLKPGNRMPSFDGPLDHKHSAHKHCPGEVENRLRRFEGYSGEELRAISAYMASLK